jgi:hypothetical protein
MPYVPFKEGTGGLDSGTTAWNKLYHFYSFHRDVFLSTITSGLTWSLLSP